MNCITPGLAAQLGRRARSAVEREFSAARMAREFAGVCEEVAASRSA